MGAFSDIYKCLNKIKENILNENTSSEQKIACNMDGPITSIYPVDEITPPLGLAITDINGYYQSAHIQTLSDEEARLYLMMKK